MRRLLPALGAALLFAFGILTPIPGLSFAPSAFATSSGEGEGHEHGAADEHLDADARLYRDLELMRGHLLIAGELVAGDHWIDAVPHVFHPIEEIYDGMKGEIEKRSLPGFLTELKVLAQTIKAKQKDAYVAALQAVNTKLNAIEQNIKASKAPWNVTVKAALISVLKTAAEEYGNAVKDGKIAEAVEYQDSRGFIWRADAMLKDGALTKNTANTATLAAAAEALAKLKSVWPAPIPPDAAVASAESVAADIEKLAKSLEAIQ